MGPRDDGDLFGDECEASVEQLLGDFRWASRCFRPGETAGAVLPGASAAEREGRGVGVTSLLGLKLGSQQPACCVGIGLVTK